MNVKELFAINRILFAYRNFDQHEITPYILVGFGNRYAFMQAWLGMQGCSVSPC
jgi:hypothetical protein